MTTTSSMQTLHPIRRVLADRDFFLLWVGQTTSLLGGQVHGVASAWLVLQMTGNPLGLGGALAVGGVASALATLAGGVLTDRIAPRRLMILMDIVRLILSGALAAQVLTGTLEVWMLYVYSVVGGLASGAFSPASMAMTPRLLPSESLQTGNSLMQGSGQLIGFLGPAAGGALIAAFPDHNLGIGLAIAFDALTFAVSLVTLWLLREPELRAAQPSSDHPADAFIAGLRYAAGNPTLRVLIGLVALANLAFAGPIMVGVPYLADTRLAEGAAAYGLIISGYAGGNVIGIVISGVLRLSARHMRVFLPVLFVVFGLGLVALGYVGSTWLAVADMAVLGVLNGFTSVVLFTGLQRSTPPEMMGRLMSLVLVAMVALTPLSQALGGVLLTWSVPALFLAAAALMAVCTIWVLHPPTSRRLGHDLTVEA